MLRNTSINFIQDFEKFTQSQLILGFSVYKWIKKSMDLWIDSDLLNDFLEFCKKYNLYCKYDVKFIYTDTIDQFKKVIWSENLTTTKVIWESIDSSNKWLIHVFISAKEKNVNKLYSYGWYPIVVNNRVIYKSYHDLTEFGYWLGYPECCRKYFFEKNDWRYYNFPYEIYKKSSKFDYRCNPFWKDRYPFSYIYHMPCSFNCKETIKYVNKIESKLEREDPTLLKNIRQHMKLPILSIREKITFAFQGTLLNNNTCIYTKYYELWDSRESNLSTYLEMGDKIEIKKDIVLFYKEDYIIYEYDTSKSNEIEKAFFIQFQ